MTSGSASATARGDGVGIERVGDRRPRAQRAHLVRPWRRERVMPDDVVTRGDELGDELLAERSGGTCDEDLHGGLLSFSYAPETRWPRPL